MSFKGTLFKSITKVTHALTTPLGFFVQSLEVEVGVSSSSILNISSAVWPSFDESNIGVLGPKVSFNFSKSELSADSSSSEKVGELYMKK